MFYAASTLPAGLIAPGSIGGATLGGAALLPAPWMALADASDRRPGAGEFDRRMGRLRRGRFAHALRRRRRSLAANSLRPFTSALGDPICFDPGVRRSGVPAAIRVQLGDSLRAAYQALLMVLSGFIPYLYLFASAWKAGRRLAAVAGIAVTLLTIVSSVVPTGEVGNIWLFEAKLLGGTALIIGSAWLVYRRGRRLAGLTYPDTVQFLCAVETRSSAKLGLERITAVLEGVWES